LDETIDTIGDAGFDAELEIIDLLIADAAEAIDAEEYLAALEGFREALRLVRRLFGDSQEISELDKTINDIDEMLEA